MPEIILPKNIAADITINQRNASILCLKLIYCTLYIASRTGGKVENKRKVVYVKDTQQDIHACNIFQLTAEEASGELEKDGLSLR